MYACNLLPHSFQFHKGTIRTVRAAGVIMRNKDFNSIKVQLERLSDEETDEFIINFNSIKVQLEPSLRPLLARCTCTFQFHKGTIRTGI